MESKLKPEMIKPLAKLEISPIRMNGRALTRNRTKAKRQKDEKHHVDHVRIVGDSFFFARKTSHMMTTITTKRRLKL